jgi:hypothetical protein
MANLPDTAAAVWPATAAIACFYAAQIVSPRDGRQRLYFSLLATTLTTLLLYYRISGSMLTMACGIQGVILLASGFPLRDRVLRISGLALLLACILKLFVWDLRHLETLAAHLLVHRAGSHFAGRLVDLHALPRARREVSVTNFRGGAAPCAAAGLKPRAGSSPPPRPQFRARIGP